MPRQISLDTRQPILYFTFYTFHLVTGNFDSTCINGGKFTESNLKITRTM